MLSKVIYQLRSLAAWTANSDDDKQLAGLKRERELLAFSRIEVQSSTTTY